MMNDEPMDELMGRALREVDPPPPTPREEMWARIQAQRAGDGGVKHGIGPGPGSVIDLSARRRRTTWIPWSAAAAAILVLGIGLGRVSRDPAARPVANAAPTAGQPAAGQPDAVPTAYRLAATSHLERTETLLASLAVDGRPGGAREMSGWARELLTDTRLLLSSPAAQDPATRRLLEDLELILAQIAGIPEARAEQEVELIHEGLNQSDVLLRLRAATAGPRLVGT